MTVVATICAQANPPKCSRNVNFGSHYNFRTLRRVRVHPCSEMTSGQQPTLSATKKYVYTLKADAKTDMKYGTPVLPRETNSLPRRGGGPVNCCRHPTPKLAAGGQSGVALNNSEPSRRKELGTECYEF